MFCYFEFDVWHGENPTNQSVPDRYNIEATISLPLPKHHTVVVVFFRRKRNIICRYFYETIIIYSRSDDSVYKIHQRLLMNPTFLQLSL